VISYEVFVPKVSLSVESITPFNIRQDEMVVVIVCGFLKRTRVHSV
jgi:hypothetical protein